MATEKRTASPCAGLAVGSFGIREARAKSIRVTPAVRTIEDPKASRQAVLDLLPTGTVLHRYVQWASAIHGSPPVFHLACAIAFLLHELDRRGLSLPKVADVGDYPLTAIFLLCCQSGTGKTSAINAVQDFSRACWADVGLDIDPWIEPDGSVQGISHAVKEQFDEERGTTSAIFYHQEASSLFAARDAVTELFCKLVDGRTLQSQFRYQQRAKKQDKNADKIVNPRLSGVLATSEAQLAPHFKEQHRLGGIFTRLLWIRPQFERQDIWFAQDHSGADNGIGKMRTSLITETAGWMASLEQMKAEWGTRFAFTPEAHAELGRLVFVPFKEAYDNAYLDDNMHGVRMRLLEKARVFATLGAAMRCSTSVETEDVVFASKLVKLFLSHTHAMGAIGAGETYRLAMRIENIIRAAKDKGTLRRELYNTTRVDKKFMDAALDTLLDAGTIFIDHEDRERNGRFVHIDSPAGQRIVEKKAEQDKITATLREMGNPSWRPS